MTSAAPKIRFRDPQVEMAHGAGGKASRRLVEGCSRRFCSGRHGAAGRRRACQHQRNARRDDHRQLRGQAAAFPGGSIGELAVNGTVNDLAVSGARAEALVVSYVLEAGCRRTFWKPKCAPWPRLRSAAGVVIAGGDTKVVEHGKADQMYITTSGIGRLIPGVSISPAAVRPGDKILLSGPDRRSRHHDSAGARRTRSGSRLCAPIPARCCRWWRRWRRRSASGIRWMRDPTRGGVATSLNELARDCGLGILLSEETIPVRDAVRGACELLGLDPLHIANEGQFLAVVARGMRRCRAGCAAQRRRAARSGVDRRSGRAAGGRGAGDDAYGGSRIVDMLVGDPLPRIC